MTFLHFIRPSLIVRYSGGLKGKGKAVSPNAASPSRKKEAHKAIGASSLLFYMRAVAKPVVRYLPGVSNGDPPLTMAQFMRVNRGEPAGEAEPASKEDTPPIESEPVFLEDLESYKAYL